MRRSLWPGLSACALAVFGLAPAAGQTSCQPELTFKETRFSEMQEQHRTWTAVLTVDASSCATTSGSFFISFIRLKEVAPDMLFSEEFTWRPGRVEVAVDFWADEAVLDYWIGSIALCPCRD